METFIIKANELTEKYILFTGLFSEGWIEQHTIAYDYEENWTGIYKIYSIERLKKICDTIIKNYKIILEPFEIDIELPRNPNKFGTYTLKTANGTFLQISGYMLMPWYNVVIIKEGG